jgi:hypothetical protein
MRYIPGRAFDEGSMFLFEKKNQKTFIRLLASAAMGANG